MSTAGADAEAAALDLREAHLQAAVDASSNGIIQLDRDGRVVTWNKAAVRILAPAVRLDHGTVLAEAFVDRPLCAQLVERSLAGEHVTARRLDVGGDDGRRGPVLLTLVPLRHGGGAAGCTAVLRDISEQTSSQEALAEGERRVRRAEALALIGTFVVDARDESEQWSEGMYQVLGVDPARFEVTLPNHLALVAEEDRPRCTELFARALAGEVLPGLDLRVDRGDGTWSWVFVAVEPRTDADGRVVGLSGVCQDISTRIATEAALQDALTREQSVSEELRRLDALKDEFLTTASHELRTPLTSILGFASVLRHAVPDRVDLVEPVERNAREMHRLIEALLDQARLESGRITVEPARFPVAPAVRTLLEERAELLGGLHVVTDIPEDVTIVMDPGAFTLVLGNLVGNAAKYAGEGTVTISAERTPGAAVVTVADEGPGIRPEYLDHLFDPFFRVPGAYRTARGSGFGLSIVRRYVELHGGTVTCESVPGDGTTFAFQVPDHPESRA